MVRLTIVSAGWDQWVWWQRSEREKTMNEWLLEVLCEFSRDYLQTIYLSIFRITYLITQRSISFVESPVWFLGLRKENGKKRLSVKMPIVPKFIIICRVYNYLVVICHTAEFDKQINHLTFSV